MKLSTEAIKKHLVTKLNLDPKSLKRVSKKKDSNKNIVRIFSSNLGTHEVISNSTDTSILSVNKLGDKSPVKKNKSKSQNPKIVIRDLKSKEILSVEELGDEEATESFNCILEQESWIADEVFALLDLECDDENYLSHESWESNDPATEDDTVIEIIVRGKHKYNLTLE